MKKSKGFTLTEILAVIVILAVLIGIGTPIYLSISKNVRTNEYNSKVKYIEAQALKYAEEQNIENAQTITVSTLITNGYIVADRYDSKDGTEVPFVTNPTDVTNNLACNLITIDVDGYDYNVSFEETQNCDLINESAAVADMNVAAYQYVNNTINKSKSIGIVNTSFNWVNTDVAVAFEPKYPNIESIKVSHNGETREIDLTKKCTLGNITTSCSNVEYVKAQTVIKDEITLIVKTKNSEKKLTVIVQIDKEPPTVTSAIYDGWKKLNEKTVTAYINDGNGSGADSVYLTNTPHFSGERNYKVSSNGVAKIDTALENGTYYLWAKDKAGNISTTSESLVVSTVDNTAPKCTESGMNSTWTRNPITINWGCSDGESGCDPEFSGGTRTFSGGQTQKEFTIPAYTIKDNAGNVTNCPAKTVTIYHDSVAPDCPVYNEKTNWTNTPVTIEYGCSDSGSGCSTRSGYITYQEGVTYEQRLVPKTDCESYFDGKDWYEKCWTSMEYQNVAVPTNEIIKTAALPAYEVVDNVGNSRTCYPSGKTVNVYYDHKKPYLKAINDPRTWNRTAYNTLDNINVSDPDSGLATYYCNPGNSMDYGATGKQIVTCKAKDNAGNESKVKFWMYHEYQARYNPKTCSATQNCNCHTESWCPCDYHTVLVSADCGGENCFTMSTQWRSECGCDEQTGQRCDQCRYTYDCSYYDCPEGGTLGADHICRY